jgi:acid phosphatase family membrane protein YuiD
MDNSILDLFKNVYFWSAFLGWTTSQSIKMLISYYRTRNLDLSYLVSTGGMPSAHWAVVCGLATSVGLENRFDSPVFMLTVAFAMITMFDASTVRRAAGLQARLLNQMIEELFKEHRFSEKKLAELLGHTRLEVFMGMIVGVLVGVIVVSLVSTL